MNGFEYKKRYDPELGRYVKKNIYSGEIQADGAHGAGLTDIFKSVFGKTMKKTAKKGLQKVASKTGERAIEHVGKKAGDKITQLLRKKKMKLHKLHLSFYLHNLHHIHKCLCHRMRLMRELTD